MQGPTAQSDCGDCGDSGALQGLGVKQGKIDDMTLMVTLSRWSESVGECENVQLA
jgi:hypothetical protein